MKRWDKEIDGELEQLDELVSNGWCWQWPGWKWVANRLNEEFGNGRTPSACRNRYIKIYSKSNAAGQTPAAQEKPHE